MTKLDKKIFIIFTVSLICIILSFSFYKISMEEEKTDIKHNTYTEQMLRFKSSNLYDHEHLEFMKSCFYCHNKFKL